MTTPQSTNHLFSSLEGPRVSESHSITVVPHESEASLKLAVAAAQSALENNGREIVILDMRNASPLFDYFVIATGTSQRQLSAMADEIQHKLEKEMNDRRYSNHAVDRSNWIVLDYGSVVIHLFDEETRQFYSLEALWGDAPRVNWQNSNAR